MGKERYTKEYTLSAAVSQVEHSYKLFCPGELFSSLDGPVFSHGEHVYFANDIARATAEKYVIGSMWDHFAAEARSGYLTFGYTGHGANSWGYCMQLSTPDLMLSLRLGCGGVYMPDDSFLTVNLYLIDLGNFIAKTRAAQLSLEVVESMGYGRYRLFDADGHGIEREMSLLECDDRVKKLNRLIAEVGLLEVRLGSLIEQFIAREDEFQNWQESHPAGSVMVLGQELFPSRAIIHSAGCPSMIEEQQSENKVLCAPEMRHLLNWAKDKTLDRPALCSICFFL